MKRSADLLINQSTDNNLFSGEQTICPALIPESVVRKDFYKKHGCREGAEQLLSRLAEFTIVRQFRLTPCFVHREDAKAPVFREGFQSRLFCTQ
jgi:hypothetical protein